MSKADPPPGARVTYSRQFRRCNKADCSTCRQDTPGHGPYWFAFWRQDGRQYSRYLGKQQPPDLAPQSPTPAPASSQLRVRTLGDFVVWRGADPVPADGWSQRKVALLFKCLLSTPGHKLHREQLLDLLWPNANQDRGPKLLRQTLYRLRQLLGRPDSRQEYVRLEGDLVVLAPMPEGSAPVDWLDALVFERAATAALAGADAVATRSALALYAGDFLPDERYEEWAVRRREVLREQYRALLLHLADLRERQGGNEEAMRCLRTLLASDPCHEDAARALMRLQAEAGRHVDALRTYQQLAQSLRRDLDLAPDNETTARYDQVRADRQAAVRQRTNLPTPLTSFLGREKELAALAEALLEGLAGDRWLEGNQPPAASGLKRLITITGSGGCGKTRLAIEVGHEVHSHYADGLWLIELASLPPGQAADPELIARQACATLGVRPSSDQSPLAGLGTILQPRQVLLILDNCEHVLASCAAFAAALLGMCPQARILATSRQALGILGETVWRLPPLAVPPPGAEVDLPLAELARLASIRLLVERARAVKSGFALTMDNRRAMVEVCRSLDGIPLAIELAAARLSLLSPSELAAHLSDRFRLLVAGNGAALPRHQTLHAVIAWSYQLLDEEEQALLRALSVFAGGWTLGAAEQVRPHRNAGKSGVLDPLARLVAKSLAQVDDAVEAPEGETRYRMLETVRQYAAERLRACGEEPAARDRLARWCLTLAEQAEPLLSGADQAAWLARLEVEHDNLRAALQWSVNEGGDRRLGVRLICCLGLFWRQRGHFREGRLWVERALASRPDMEAGVRATALNLGGNLAYAQDDNARALALYEESLALRRTLGDPAHIANALSNVGNVALANGDYARARSLYEEGLVIMRELGKARDCAINLNNLGVLAGLEGEHARAFALYEECWRMWREIGDPWHTAGAISNLGRAASDLGDLERARDWFRESLRIRRDLGDRKGIILTLHSLSNLVHRQGDDERAARILGAAAALGMEIGVGPPSRDQAEHDHMVAAIRQALGPELFAGNWAAGQAMTYDRAIECAMGEVGGLAWVPVIRNTAENDQEDHGKEDAPEDAHALAREQFRLGEREFGEGGFGRRPYNR
ncbi:MAG TPA: tetratricopeptide repeat protein [Chloroflexota bacterium]